MTRDEYLSQLYLPLYHLAVQPTETLLDFMHKTRLAQSRALFDLYCLGSTENGNVTCL